MNENIIQQSLDSIFARSSIGSLDKALTNNIRGINALQTHNVLMGNQDTQGYLFVTRPQLNLQKDNLRNVPSIYGLLNEDPACLGLAVRMILDPRIGVGYSYMEGTKFEKKIPALQSKLVDPNNPWITFFTNNVISSTGCSDKTLPMTSTDPGLYRQTYSFIDGISRNLGEWDLTINVQNVRGDLSIATIAAWMDYASYIKEERMVPYFDYLVNNRIDYHSRAYRLIMDKNKEYVTKIMACAAMTPSSCPMGMFGDFDRKTPFSEQTKELSFRFRCMGQFENDARLIDAFNGVTRCFNPWMDDVSRAEYMVQIPRRYLQRFQSMCYPLINRSTLRLEWWAKREVWEAGMAIDNPSFAEM